MSIKLIHFVEFKNIKTGSNVTKYYIDNILRTKIFFLIPKYLKINCLKSIYKTYGPRRKKKFVIITIFLFIHFIISLYIVIIHFYIFFFIKIVTFNIFRKNL